MRSIDPAQAEEYFRLHAEHAKLVTRLDTLKKILLPQLVDGAASPAELPFLLINRPQKRKQADWKGFALGLLVKLKRSADKAKLALDKQDAAWPEKPIPALHVIVNPDYVPADRDYLGSD